jgi:hypothetical protein
MRSGNLRCGKIRIIAIPALGAAVGELGFEDVEFWDPESRSLPETLARVMAPLNTISANDSCPEDAARPSLAAAVTPAHRVFLNPPETLHRQMIERARSSAQDPGELYQSALIAFARSLDCGARLRLSGAEPGGVGVYVQLSADRRRWLRRLASRLSLTESDIVSAAAGWLLAGGVAPSPTVAYDRSRQPQSIHDPPG